MNWRCNGEEIKGGEASFITYICIYIEMPINQRTQNLQPEEAYDFQILKYVSLNLRFHTQ